MVTRQQVHLCLLFWQPFFHLSSYFYVYFFFSTSGFFLFLQFDGHNFQSFLTSLYLVLMGFCLFGALCLSVIVGIKQLFVACVPNAIEDCSCEAVNREDLATAITEVYEDEHSNL